MTDYLTPGQIRVLLSDFTAAVSAVKKYLPLGVQALETIAKELSERPLCSRQSNPQERITARDYNKSRIETLRSWFQCIEEEIDEAITMGSVGMPDCDPDKDPNIRLLNTVKEMANKALTGVEP
jgi:hypothetical protein